MMQTMFRTAPSWCRPTGPRDSSIRALGCGSTKRVSRLEPASFEHLGGFARQELLPRVLFVRRRRSSAMGKPASYASVPAQPDKDFYGLAELGLFTRFTRASYRAQFGVEAP